MTLRQLVTEALDDKLREMTPQGAAKEPAWLKLGGAFGSNASDRAETRRIQKVIDEEFGALTHSDVVPGLKRFQY